MPTGLSEPFFLKGLSCFPDLSDNFSVIHKQPEERPVVEKPMTACGIYPFVCLNGWSFKLDVGKAGGGVVL